VFARLTAAQNLEFYRNRSLPLEARFPQAITYFESTNQVLKLYLAAYFKKATGGAELVELLGAELRGAVVMLDLVDEFLPTVRKDDPSYEVRMAGLEKVKQGLATMVAGGLQTLTERDSYRTAERVRLIDYMNETLPAILPRLPAGARVETLVRLESMAKDDGLKDLQPALGELSAAARSWVDAGKAP